jgi:hypothetical protein
VGLRNRKSILWTENGFVPSESDKGNKMQNTDPMMTVREYLTLPKNQAEVFLKLWAERQPNQSRAVSQAQGLRLRAALAVADGTEQNHPPENQSSYRENKADYDHGDLGPRETHEEVCIDCYEEPCDCDHGQYARRSTGLHWEDQVDPWGRTFKEAWKQLGAGIEQENERVRALNAAGPKTDLLGPKKEG